LPAVTSREKAKVLAESLTPLLDSYGLMLLISPVEVIRSEKFQ
jgi:hypothetical protein